VRSTESLIADAVAAARYFKVLSDPTRLAIVRLLLHRAHSVGELVAILQVPQSRISNHLACLRWCHFVEVDRDSRRVIYRIADPRLRKVLSYVDILSGEQCDHLNSCTRIGPDWV
jgi:ArsR family transcriptional regulator